RAPLRAPPPGPPRRAPPRARTRPHPRDGCPPRAAAALRDPRRRVRWRRWTAERPRRDLVSSAHGSARRAELAGEPGISRRDRRPHAVGRRATGVRQRTRSAPIERARAARAREPALHAEAGAGAPGLAGDGADLAGWVALRAGKLRR